MSRAAEIEAQAARWLLRQEEPDWSVEEQSAFELWLDAATEHRVAFYRLEHGWRRADRLKALGVEGAWGGRTPRRWRPMVFVAAVAAGLAAALVLLPYRPWFGDRTFRTEVGGQLTAPLADGSVVELNTDSRLRTAVTGTARNVWLDRGEAYFQVAHDARHPFVVHAGQRRVTVLGTRFSVRRDGDRVMVVVLDGRVRVDRTDTAGPAGALVLIRGDEALAQGRSTLVVARSVQAATNALTWREGTLTFDQQTLADAAAEFNRYNRKKIVIADAEVAAIRIGGAFDAKNVEAFARLLQQAYGLKIQQSEDEIRISG